MSTELATFGAGCFWGVEAEFRQVPGVLDARVGYSGGWLQNPTYQDVCTDRTGHAEVIQIQYDPAQVTYERLLEVFFDIHNPTTLNRQGPDIGTQYRSVIFYHTLDQHAAAQAAIKRLDAMGKYRQPVVTALEPASAFYPAGDYHQRYLEKRGLAHC